ncbi:MAG: type III secretion system export apparatus subunit SctU [Pseudomonadota bacterium]
MENSSEKTEQPTQKKIRDAREKGQVSSSKELVSAAQMIGMYIIFFLIGGYFVKQMMEMILLPAQYYGVSFHEALAGTFHGSMRYLIDASLPFVAGMVVLGILITYLQVGPLFSVDPVLPSMEKIDPIAGFKRIFSLKNFMEFVKSCIKVVAITIACLLVIRANIQDIIEMPVCGKECVLPFLAHLMLQLALYTSVVFILIAVADIFFQKYEHTKSLRMTKDEVKREYKDTEGNPEIKHQRKSIHREIIQGDELPKAVKKSSVIVSNPTHLVVGLIYDGKTIKVPRVILKGENLLAKRIKELARDFGIPIVENVPLARELHARVEWGDAIPRDMFPAVAELMKWVKQLEAAATEAD